MDFLNRGILYVSTLINNEKKYDDYDSYLLTDKTISRMKELGLDTFTKSNKDVKINVIEELEVVAWKDANQVKKPRFGMPKESHLTKSLNFLETFSIYASASNFRHTEVNKDVTEKKMDNTVYKAVKEIEDINTLLKTGGFKATKTDQKILGLHIKRLLPLINKVFTNDLTITQQKAFSKVIGKAIAVLEKFTK